MLTSKPAPGEHGKYENVKCTLNDRELIKIALQIASGMQHLESKKVWRCFRNISKKSARVSSGFETRETFELFETTRPQAVWFYCFRAFGNLMKPEARGFEITTSPTKKISLNYHVNISFLNSTIIFET